MTTTPLAFPQNADLNNIINASPSINLFGSKTENDFRIYSTSPESAVASTYRLNHRNQSFQFVSDMKRKYTTHFNKAIMSVWDSIKRLDSVVDESDPDTSLPQIVHALQTAESLRELHPEIEWIPLIGLLHDLGKVLALPEWGNEPQWCVVGDTFPVGCAFSPSNVYYEYFQENPDWNHPVYSTQYGIYTPNCGLRNLNFSFGHDEYLYQVLKHNGCLIPEEGLQIIRFHSFYPWHKHGAYYHFMNEEDHTTLKWVQLFSKLDLYSKDAKVPNVEELMPFYQALIKKYFPNEVLNW